MNIVTKWAAALTISSVLIGAAAATPALADRDDYPGHDVRRDVHDIRADRHKLDDLYVRRAQEVRRHDWDDVHAIDRRIHDVRLDIDRDRRDVRHDFDAAHRDRGRDFDR